MREAAAAAVTADVCRAFFANRLDGYERENLEGGRIKQRT